MKTHACVIVPRDLLERISDSNQKSGWFSGLKLKAENIFLVIQCIINSEEVVTTNPRMLPHRSANLTLGSYEQELLQWIAVESGFNTKYAGRKLLTDEEYRETIGLEIPGERLYFAAIEPGENGPILTSKVARKSNHGRLRLLPAESIVLAPDAKPFIRLPGENSSSLEQQIRDDRWGR